ncbi:MAG: SLBB domain-containing protein [Deltaproteobacteria bacterium]|nr:MAG: SLBB domain-containing protein [Deltaproteobacteria bacterium]
MRVSGIVLGIVLGLGVAVGSWGEESSGYRIGAGDLLDVQVWREPDLSGPHPVDRTGSMRHVLAGEIPAADRTVEEVALELRERLERDYLREARVVVTVANSARRRVSVLGAVANPGVYPVSADARVLDVVTAAGGLSERADRTATLIHATSASDAQDTAPSERTELDLAALFDRGELSANPPVAPGDVLVVASRDSAPLGAEVGRVRVVGEVARPGVYALDEAGTVLDAVLVAGGLTEYAAANRAKLVRGQGETREEERVRLGDLLNGRQRTANPALRGGDLIVVPESFF